MKTYFKDNKFLLSLTVLIGIISSLGYVFIAILLQQLLDIVMAGNMEKFTRVIIFSLVYFAILGIFLFLQSLFEKKVICKIMRQIRSDTFRGIVNHSIEDFNKNNSADYISSITNDVKILEDNFLLPLFEVIQYSVIFISSLAVMIYFDAIVTVCVIVAIGLMFVVPSLIGGVLEKQQNQFSEKLSDFTVSLKDILSGFEIIKSYSMKKYIIYRFDKSNQDTINAKYSVDKLIALNEGLSSFLALIVQVVVLFLSAYFIIKGRITVGALLGMVQVGNNLANPLLMIFTNIPKIKSVQPIVKKLHDLSTYTKDEVLRKNSLAFNGYISAKNLSFSYDKQVEVLHGIDCTIEKGKKYVIVGKSGCGKTTLIKLLSGCYTGYSGNILYDGNKLNSPNKSDVVLLSSTIHQNVYMFDETINDNICLHEDYPDEIVTKAVKESGLDEFISKLPEGLKYKVGENGSNLSGGQKQRIAVARAMIRNKPILILDEGTSAIDMQTAYDIESRLLAMKSLTLITITHNIKKELLQLYDNVIYMENGTIQGNDSFNKLIKTSQEFSKYIEVVK
ncbi:ABC transporter ATP-binding protein [Cuneatibacter caecimuris]|uniref:ABC-type multidrug transport system fused ATPase/permease subunit n=1 Tax=Cuneatibacter caecimuris TaxID=1796618 RepID=A0A4Q7PKZ8_9FIRM|nr:ABC transporter ATP-binding protein [Cuneatibacter caecimuris]RZT01215.1 ABC-type multidrug transport system fused ATPase/permease subunit [Cuneatibacter caecimuris]